MSPSSFGRSGPIRLRPRLVIARCNVRFPHIADIRALLQSAQMSLLRRTLILFAALILVASLSRCLSLAATRRHGVSLLSMHPTWIGPLRVVQPPLGRVALSMGASRALASMWINDKPV